MEPRPGRKVRTFRYRESDIVGTVAEPATVPASQRRCRRNNSDRTTPAMDQTPEKSSHQPMTMARQNRKKKWIPLLLHSAW